MLVLIDCFIQLPIIYEYMMLFWLFKKKLVIQNAAQRKAYLKVFLLAPSSVQQHVSLSSEDIFDTFSKSAFQFHLQRIVLTVWDLNIGTPQLVMYCGT